MAFRHEVTVKWRDLEDGATVFLKGGTPWTLVSRVKDPGGWKVTVKDRSRTFTSVVPKKGEVLALRRVDGKAESGGVDFSALHAEIEARTKLKTRQDAPKVHSKPAFTKERAGWGFSPAGDAAEAAIREGLDAQLVGVRLTRDEAYTVPLVDPSTIAGHLFLFHGIGPLDVKKPGGWEEAAKIHEGEHASLGGECRIPHFHDKNRPEIARGPRFR